MTRKDASYRNSSATSSSTDSWKSTDTVKGPGSSSLFRGPSRRGAPMQVKTDRPRAKWWAVARTKLFSSRNKSRGPHMAQ
ncbi:adenylate cyclase protein [Rutstroemia sp. NJR-2017a BBW]|nr:adenylate cyclase protein [Rutstroemia sp. NJR-2017a BBW]